MDTASCLGSSIFSSSGERADTDTGPTKKIVIRHKIAE